MPARPAELPSLAGPARPRPVVAAGERAAVLGEEASGVREVLLHPVTAIVGLETGLSAGGTVEVSPAGLRREVASSAGTVLESALVFRRLPAAVLQWAARGTEAGAGAEPSGPARLAWRSPGAVGIADGEGGPLRLRLPDGHGELLFVARPRSARWHVEPAGASERERGAEDGARVELRVPQLREGPVTLLATVVRDDAREARAAVDRLPRLEDELRGWVRSAAPGGGRALEVETPEPELARATTWAAARLACSVIRTDGEKRGRVVAGYGGAGRVAGAERPAHPRPDAATAPPEPGAGDAAWIVHGLLAAGRHDAARGLVVDGLGRLARDPPQRDQGAASPGPERVLLLHATARCILWTGDAAPLRSAEDHLRRALEAVRTSVRDPGPARAPRLLAAAAAFREMADAVEGAGRREWAERLRAAARSTREEFEHRRDAGDADPTAIPGSLPPGMLAAVLDAPRPSGPTEVWTERRQDARRRPSGRPGAGLRAWAEWERGDVESGLELWRGLLRRGMDDGGLWGSERGEGPPSGGRPWDTATTALVPAALVFGLLGARADAAYGRLRLAPRIPAAWSDLTVSGLRVGDSTLRLSYRRDGPEHTFVCDPLAGRVPLNLVLEPLLPLRAIEAARVDGEPADLEQVRSRGRTGIRVQLPLDSSREMTVVGDHADGT